VACSRLFYTLALDGVPTPSPPLLFLGGDKTSSFVSDRRDERNPSNFSLGAADLLSPPAEGYVYLFTLPRL